MDCGRPHPCAVDALLRRATLGTLCLRQPAREQGCAVLLRPFLGTEPAPVNCCLSVRPSVRPGGPRAGLHLDVLPMSSCAGDLSVRPSVHRAAFARGKAGPRTGDVSPNRWVSPTPLAPLGTSDGFTHQPGAGTITRVAALEEDGPRGCPAQG